MDSFLSALAGLAWGRGTDALVLGNDFLSSFVAVSGDAHQAKVAQDLFRQEVRYERSLQIREDIRDVNKCMMESVQTHVLMGSIILAVCFSMSIEGYSGVQTERLLDTLWLLFTSWAATFTFVALWLALRFQMKISGSARERLLRRHRFMVPDDLVVGKMGGENLVDQMADFHNWVLNTMEDLTSAQTDEETLQQKCEPLFLKAAKGMKPLRVPVETLEDEILDTEPLRKGLHAWLHESGEGYSQHKTLEVPYFLLGETCLRMPWMLQADGPSLKIRVFGDATLYVSAQCVPGDAPVKSSSHMGSSPSSPVSAAGVRKALRLESSVPAWPADELPLVRTGFNEKWRGESGYGEFRRVEGFSIFVDRQRAMELPLYKIVLASPSDFGVEYIDVVVQWNFKTACEALTVVLRRGHVHCKEEDFPLAEFNAEVKKMLPVRRYAGSYLATGTICLLVATFLMVAARMYNVNRAHTWWWFEVLLALVAFLPGCVLLNLMPVEGGHGDVSQAIHSINSVEHAHEPKPSFLNQFRRTMSSQAEGLRRKESTVGSDEMSDELDEENNYSTDLAQRLAALDAFRLGQREEEHEEAAEAAEAESSVAFDCFSESVFCRDVMRASSEKINAVTSSCQRVWRAPAETPKPAVYRKRESSLSDPRIRAPFKEAVSYRVSFQNQVQALWSDLRHGLERPRSLQFWTVILHTLFTFSVISAVIIRFMVLSNEGLQTSTSISWTTLTTEWPAFFQPTAVELADGQLFVATDGVVQKFQWSTSGYAPVGQALQVPGTARGLTSQAGQLAVISNEGYFDIDPSWTNSTVPSAFNGALGILEAPESTSSTLTALLPWQLSAAGALDGALVLASDRTLRFCRLPVLPSLSLEVLLELPMSEVTALRLDATVLWAVQTSQVLAISLRSGETLAQFDTNLPSGAAIVGLTGNNSHLVAMIVQEGHEAQLVVTPYPELPSATLEL
eukprot:Skav226671  [mRNA]  locus=scaffold861:248489:251374:+ [translate_table: standard]